MITLHKHETSLKEKLAIIIALALPAVIENILQTAVGFIDVLFVSHLGLDAVSAVSAANAVLAIYMAIFMAIGVGTSSLIARSVGANHWHDAKHYAKQSTIISILVGLILGLATIWLSEPLLRLIGAKDNVLILAQQYFNIVAIPSILIALMFNYGSILRAIGNTKGPMLVGIWINIIHILLDYVLIFGTPFTPALEIQGAALATVIVRFIGVIALFIMVKRSAIRYSILEKTEKHFSTAILKLSTPTAIERLIMRIGQFVYFGFIIQMGSTVYASHNIAANIESFSFMPGFGLAVAATTLVGQSIGANRAKDAYTYGILTTSIGVVFMSVMGVILYVFSPIFASWFTNDSVAIDNIVTALRIDAFAQPAVAISIIIAGALQGAGDTKSPMYSTAIGMWCLRVLGVYILGVQLNMGIAGVWLAITIDLYCRSIYLYYRFKRIKHLSN